MKSGRLAIQNVRGRGLSSHLIAWWGCGWNGYSHSDALMHDGRLVGARSDRIGTLLNGDPAPAGIQSRQPFYDRWVRRTVYFKEVPAARADEWEALAAADIGTRYDKAGIWRLIVGEQPVVDGWWFCSAYQIDRLQQLGEVRKDLCVPPQQCTPDDLALILSVVGWQSQELPVA